MVRSALSALLIAGVSILGAACTSSQEDANGTEDAFTSGNAVALEFRFKGEVIAAKDDIAKKAIVTQIAYVQGTLTTHANSNALAGMPTLSNIREEVDGDKKRITYDAALSVAWSKYMTVPSTYDFTFPLDVTSTALSDFNTKYDGPCGKNEYGHDTFWHDFNPHLSTCVVEDADVYKAKASVVPNPKRTQGKYPEYDQVWSDDSLDVVAVFAIIESSTPTDENAKTREAFLAGVAGSLQNAHRTETPLGSGIIADSTVMGTTKIDGREKRVNVTGLLINEVSTAGPSFNERYEALSAKADLIIYEGHSGLGVNINALASATGAQAGKYQLVFLNGCQTLSYLGPSMHEKRIALNGAAADPYGTKFLDVVANGRPAFGDDGKTSLSLYRALLDVRAPKTFNAILEGISLAHLATAFGEDDNTFRP